MGDLFSLPAPDCPLSLVARAFAAFDPCFMLDVTGELRYEEETTVLARRRAGDADLTGGVADR